MKKSNVVAQFAEHVRAYKRWVLSGKASGANAARQLLALIVDLYRQALVLPPAEHLKGGHKTLVTQKKRKFMMSKRIRLPFEYYSEVFDPLPVPPETPVVGSLSFDDIPCIYHDLVEKGLSLYDRGYTNDAIWEWKFSLQTHWGEHATSAIRALHCWLAKNDAFGID